MDPNHVLHRLIDSSDRFQVRFVEFFVELPVLIILILLLVDIEGFKVVEEWSQYELVELQKLCEHILSVEDWHAVELLEDLPNLLLLLFIFYENAWPANPNRLHDRVPLLQVEHVVVKDAL